METELKPSDRETLEKVAAGFRDLSVLQMRQRQTQALMLRACIARVQSPDARKRREAIDGLVALADMLEGKHSTLQGEDR